VRRTVPPVARAPALARASPRRARTRAPGAATPRRPLLPRYQDFLST
jgi:hypothetical protein